MKFKKDYFFNSKKYLQKHPEIWPDILLSEHQRTERKLHDDLFAHANKSLSNYFTIPKKKSIFTIILKTKDEPNLLEDWIRYHAQIVGIENIIIIDHNSTNPKVHKIYAKFPDLVVLPLPKETIHDSAHHTKIFCYLYDFVRRHSLFFTLLDTDEFLCRFNGKKFTISNFKLHLLSYWKSNSLGSVWLHNTYQGDTEDVTKLEIFSIDKENMESNIANGKAIFRYDKNHANITHNKAIGEHSVTSDIFLLHFKFKSIEDRIKTQINYCISKKLISTFENELQLIEDLKKIPEEKRPHPVKEIISYYKDKELYKERLLQQKHTSVLKSNIVSEVLTKEPSFFESPVDISKLVEKIFPRVTLWKKDTPKLLK